SRLDTTRRAGSIYTSHPNHYKCPIPPLYHRLSLMLFNILVAKQPYEKTSLNRLGVFAVKRFRPPLLHIILKAAMSLDPNLAEFGSVTFLKQPGGCPCAISLTTIGNCDQNRHSCGSEKGSRF